ncbi:MAG TPA: ATP-binding protein [Patescibacteria group bacterium]|nr:ATP-binding protein [Patescibacteria group bacterium]
MFKSARIKLTLFFSVILVVFSFALTLTIRILAERQYLHSNQVQRGTVQQIILGLPDRPTRWPNNDYINSQEDQAAEVRTQLNVDLILINIAALFVGGALSYWFAGRMLKPIEEAHEVQARFASDASHELRTPLTSLKLENEVFLRQKSFSEKEARQLINSNLEEVQRLEGLSSNLLSLTQYGNTTLELTTIPVKPIATTAAKSMHAIAEAKKVNIKIEAEAAMVRGHHDSLAQLLGILLDNAIKYGAENSTVTIGGQRRDGHYLLWVQDEGPGIDDKDLPHIFERLYRGDKARSGKDGGYGLGLSLAKAISTANGAEVRAQNVPTGGACLMLRIPLSK